MSQKMILQFAVHADKRDEFVAMMNAGLDDTRSYDGCQTATIWLPENDPGAVWIYEEWESREQQGAYAAWRMGSGMAEMLGPFVTGPPIVVWLTEA